MTLGNSTAIQDQRVYAQDTEPKDTRDGIIWVDTLNDETKVYSADSAMWEPIAAQKLKHGEGFAPFYYG